MMKTKSFRWAGLLLVLGLIAMGGGAEAAAAGAGGGEGGAADAGGSSLTGAAATAISPPPDHADSTSSTGTPCAWARASAERSTKCSGAPPSRLPMVESRGSDIYFRNASRGSARAMPWKISPLLLVLIRGGGETPGRPGSEVRFRGLVAGRKALGRTDPLGVELVERAP